MRIPGRGNSIAKALSQDHVWAAGAMVRSLVCREHWFYGSSRKGCLNPTDTWGISRRRELVSVFLQVTLKGILRLGVGLTWWSSG